MDVIIAVGYSLIEITQIKRTDNWYQDNNGAIVKV